MKEMMNLNLKKVLHKKILCQLLKTKLFINQKIIKSWEIQKEIVHLRIDFCLKCNSNYYLINAKLRYN